MSAFGMRTITITASYCTFFVDFLIGLKGCRSAARSSPSFRRNAFIRSDFFFSIHSRTDLLRSSSTASSDGLENGCRGDLTVPGGDNAVKSSFRLSLFKWTPSSTACLPPNSVMQTTNKTQTQLAGTQQNLPLKMDTVTISMATYRSESIRKLHAMSISSLFEKLSSTTYTNITTSTTTTIPKTTQSHNPP